MCRFWMDSDSRGRRKKRTKVKNDSKNFFKMNAITIKWCSKSSLFRQIMLSKMSLVVCKLIMNDKTECLTRIVFLIFFVGTRANIDLKFQSFYFEYNLIWILILFKKSVTSENPSTAPNNISWNFPVGGKSNYRSILEIFENLNKIRCIATVKKFNMKHKWMKMLSGYKNSGSCFKKGAQR